jgi:hypothetical protein
MHRLRQTLIRFTLLSGTAILAGSLSPDTIRAGIVVVGNRTDTNVKITVVTTGNSTREYQIGAAEVLTLPVAREVRASYDDGIGRVDCQFEVDSLYYFTRRGKRMELQRVQFASVAADERPKPDVGTSGGHVSSPLPVGGIASFFRMGIVPVMMLVDDEEPAVDIIWEERIRNRIEKASDIIESYCGIRFRVVATGKWDSNDDIEQWTQATREFETEVIPAPAALALGFTSQYELPGEGRMRLGAIRGPLRPHILIREGPPRVSEPERLEVLVHELGHYLGAIHCPQPDSVMRPLLADGRARARSFPIRFDGVNTLIMNLVAGEIRNRGIRTLNQINPNTKQQLHSIYRTVAGEIPDDEVAEHHIRMLKVTPRSIPSLVVKPESLVTSTRAVVRAVLKTAETNRASLGQAVTGDGLATMLVRSAAAAAAPLPSEQRKNAFLLGLAIALDDSTLLRKNPLTGPLCRQVESDAERDHRLQVLGSPTMGGRRDLAKHFVVSCGLAAVFGAEVAEATGIAKEMLDARGGSGFSFADLAADLAGIAFAEQIAANGSNLATVANSFRVDQFFPAHDDLAEGLTWQELLHTYGSTQDVRFRRQKSAIRERIQALPGYGTAVSGNPPS